MTIIDRALAPLAEMRFQANLTVIRKSGRDYRARIGDIRRVGVKATAAIEPAISHPQTQGSGAIAGSVEAAVKSMTAAALQLELLGTGIVAYANALQQLDRLGLRPPGVGPVDDDDWLAHMKTALKAAKVGNKAWKTALRVHRRDLESALKNIETRVGFYTFPDGREVMLVQRRNKVVGIDVSKMPSAQVLNTYPDRIGGLKNLEKVPGRIGYGLGGASSLLAMFTGSDHARMAAAADLIAMVQEGKQAAALTQGAVGMSKVFGTASGVLNIGAGVLVLTDPTADGAAQVGGGLQVVSGGAGLHALMFAGGPTPVSVATSGAAIGWGIGDMVRRSYESGRTPTWYTTPVEGPLYELYKRSEAAGQAFYGSRHKAPKVEPLSAGMQSYLKEREEWMRGLSQNLPGARVAPARPGEFVRPGDHGGFIVYLPTT